MQDTFQFQQDRKQSLTPKQGKKKLSEQNSPTSTARGSTVDVRFFAMKRIKKKAILSGNFSEYTIQEKKILLEMEHPFVLKLHYAFQTSESLYLMLDIVNGGDLFYHIKKRGHLSEKEAKFFGAQIILGLEFLHENKIVYRDLKPENILLDSGGYIKLADFGISKKLQEEELTKSMIGTIQYLAPEIFTCKKKGYDFCVDVWSLGCCLYEIVVGDPPFQGTDHQQMKNKVMNQEFIQKDYFSKNFKSLLQGLLYKNPEKRLTLEKAKQHPFFEGINWEDLLAKKLKSPLKPKIKSELDLKFFDKKFHEQDVMNQTHTTQNSLISGSCQRRQKELFHDFTYNMDFENDLRGLHHTSSRVNQIPSSSSRHNMDICIREGESSEENSTSANKIKNVKSFLMSQGSVSKQSIIVEEEEVQDSFTDARITKRGLRGMAQVDSMIDYKNRTESSDWVMQPSNLHELASHNQKFQLDDQTGSFVNL